MSTQQDDYDATSYYNESCKPKTSAPAPKQNIQSPDKHLKR